jgi:hypothetical protein
MCRHSLAVFLAVLGIASLSAAKSNKKQLLPDYVLRAQTVLVVINPEAGEPVTNPAANRTAQENVEKALTHWGRFRLVMEAQTADLIIAVSKGHASGPTIHNAPSDSRPVIIQPSDGGIRIGGQQGRQPGPGLGGGPPDRGPQIGNEASPSEDRFEIYRGGVDQPLDSAPVWRYMAKGALEAPRVIAVEQFRKAVTESEKQHQQKP